MLRWGKRGQSPFDLASVEWLRILIAVIAAVMLIGLLVKFTRVGELFVGGQQVQCGNAGDFLGVTRALQRLEAGKSVPEVFFANSDCALVSFNDAQYREEELGVVSRSPKTAGGPRVCLCKLEGGVCLPYKECYRFAKVQTINAKQFSSADFEENVFLKFVLAGSALSIEVVGKQRQPTSTYVFEERFRSLDEEGLVQKVVARFTALEQVKRFLPIVRVQERPALLPVELPQVGNFPLLFQVTLAEFPVTEEISVQEFVAHPKVLGANVIRGMEMEVVVPQAYKASLPQGTQYALRLFAKTDRGWRGYPMQCEERGGATQCKGTLDQYASEFALSAVQENV